MFVSSKQSQNYGDLHSGESLFHYLKRRKKFALQGVIDKSNYKQKGYSDIRQATKEYRQEQKVTSARKGQDKHSDDQIDFICVTDRKSIIAKGQLSSTITPRTVKFLDSEQKHTNNKSFVNMISPLKNKSQKGIGLNNYSQLSSTKLSKQKSIKLLKRNNSKQTFSRKNLDSSLYTLKDTLQTIISTGKSLKQKVHCIFLQTKPLFGYLEESSNNKIIKQVAGVKDMFRSLETNFKKLDIQNSNQTIQQFHIVLRQHLDTLEAGIYQQYQKQYLQRITNLKDQHHNQIKNLESDIATMKKNVEISQKKLTKNQQKLMKIIQEKQINQEEINNNLSIRIQNYQQKISNLQKQIKILNQQLEKYQSQNKELTKEKKSIQYLKQSMEKQFAQEKQNIIVAKQEYLLNEIVMLKQQFKRDINQLIQLSKLKEDDYQRVIDQLKDKQNCLKQQAHESKERMQTSVADRSRYLAQLQACQKQNECLISDLHRMNEELYQHWLALKDIQILSKRLNIFDKFRQIYNDLAYNEFLFS